MASEIENKNAEIEHKHIFLTFPNRADGRLNIFNFREINALIFDPRTPGTTDRYLSVPF